MCHPRRVPDWRSINVARIHDGIVTAFPFPNRRLAVGVLRICVPTLGWIVSGEVKNRRQAVGLGKGRPFFETGCRTGRLPDGWGWLGALRGAPPPPDRATLGSRRSLCRASSPASVGREPDGASSFAFPLRHSR